MFRFLLVMLMVVFSVSAAFGNTHIVDGFDFPIGVPNAQPRSQSEWHITQPFERNPNDSCIGDGHLGDDWNFAGGSSDLDSLVFACANGVVIYAQDYDSGLDSWEGVVIVRHTAPPGHHFTLPYNHGERDEVITVYAHLWYNQIAVAVGDTIRRGDLVGKIGQTPAPPSDFPHLHLAIVTDVSLTPAQILANGYSCNAARQDQFTWPKEFIEANRSPRKKITAKTDFPDGNVGEGLVVINQPDGPEGDGMLMLANSVNSIGSWSTTDPMPYAISGMSCAIRGNQVFLTGGSANSPFTAREIIRGVVQSNGSVDWDVLGLGTFDATRYHTSTIWNNYLYVIGTPDGVNVGDHVWMVHLDPKGNLGQWRETTPLPYPLFQHATVVDNGFIYVLGGNSLNSAFAEHDEVLRGEISSDGSIISWVELSGNALPDSLMRFQAVVSNGYLAIMGGYGPFSEYPSDVIHDEIRTAKILTNGELGPWQLAGNLPVPLYSYAAATGGNKIIISGGNSTSGSETLKVRTVEIDNSGNATVTELTDLPSDHYEHASVVIDNVLYVFGGNGNLCTCGPQWSTVLRSDLVTGSEFIHSGLYGVRFPLALETEVEYLIRGSDSPAGTADSLRYRLAGDDGAFGTWSDWKESNQVSIHQSAQFVDCQVKLTGNGSDSPRVYDITLHFRGDESGVTPSGNDIIVTKPGLTVTFPEVGNVGTSELVTPPNVQNPPGYKKIRLLDFITSATYTGAVKLDIGFDKYIIQDPDDLRLFHWNSNTNQWEDITAFVDSDNGFIRGFSNTLSPFFVGEYDGITGIGDTPSVDATKLSVSCYPNPFNPRTTIRFNLPSKTEASVSVYDASGHLVATVFNGLATAGLNEVSWDGRSDNGTVSASGVYFCKVVTPNQTASGKLVLLK